MVAEVVRASETDEQILNQPPGPPVEVFTDMVSNDSEWSVAETSTKAGILSYISVENIYSNFGGDRPPLAVKILELSQAS